MKIKLTQTKYEEVRIQYEILPASDRFGPLEGITMIDDDIFAEFSDDATESDIERITKHLNA